MIDPQKFILECFGLGSKQPLKDRLFAWVMWLIPLLLFSFLLSNLSPHTCECFNGTSGFASLRINCRFAFENCTLECGLYNLTLLKEYGLSDYFHANLLSNLDNTTPIIINTVGIN
jgi:hypothetical protein